MAKESQRSILRLLFFEGLALAGFLHLQSHPLASNLWEWTFTYNAYFFLVAYPLLYIYRWKMTDGCLNAILWPLSFVLGWGLGASVYLWMTYSLLFMGNRFAYTLMDHGLILGLLFVFVYFPLIQPVMGTTQNYYSLGQLVGIFFYSALGGLLGFLLGQFVDHKFGTMIGLDSRRFLLWLALTLIGTAIGALVAQRGARA